MQPIIIQDAIAIAAGIANNNVIVSNNSLRALQRLPFPAKISLAMVASATGLIIDFDVGSQSLVAASNGRVSASSPEIPLDTVNDDMYGYEGDLLILKAVNPTGGAITLRYLITATPLADPGEQVQLPPNVRVIVQGPTNVPNATVDLQLLDGLKYERPPVDSILDIFMTASATGMTRTVYVSEERVAPSSAIAISNRIPQDPFDVTIQGIEVEQDKEIQLAITNATGGALNIFWKIKLQEMIRK